MGQKVNPIGFRVTVNKDWRSRWYADKKEFGNLLHEDLMIRELVKNRLKDAAVPEVIIERYANRARVTIFTARPGIVIGRKGQDIERLREEIAAQNEEGNLRRDPGGQGSGRERPAGGREHRAAARSGACRSAAR